MLTHEQSIDQKNEKYVEFSGWDTHTHTHTHPKLGIGVGSIQTTGLEGKGIILLPLPKDKQN